MLHLHRQPAVLLRRLVHLAAVALQGHPTIEIFTDILLPLLHQHHLPSASSSSHHHRALQLSTAQHPVRLTCSRAHDVVVVIAKLQLHRRRRPRRSWRSRRASTSANPWVAPRRRRHSPPHALGPAGINQARDPPSPEQTRVVARTPRRPCPPRKFLATVPR